MDLDKNIYLKDGFEKEQKSQCQKNQRLTTKGSPEQRRGMKNRRRESISGPSVARWMYFLMMVLKFFGTGDKRKKLN